MTLRKAGRPVRLWDAPTRVFHWVLVALLGALWWTGSNGLLDWHRRAGYCVVALLLFRVFWGFAGGSSARFSSFLKGPRTIASYIRHDMFRRDGVPHLGHNPVGGWSVVAMLSLLAVQTGLGLISVDIDGLESGPFSYLVGFDTGRWAAGLHHIFFNLILAIVMIHIIAIAFYLIARRENLIIPMISGNKMTNVEDKKVYFVSVWRGIALIIFSGISVWMVISICGR